MMWGDRGRVLIHPFAPVEVPVRARSLFAAAEIPREAGLVTERGQVGVLGCPRVREEGQRCDPAGHRC